MSKKFNFKESPVAQQANDTMVEAQEPKIITGTKEEPPVQFEVRPKPVAPLAENQSTEVQTKREALRQEYMTHVIPALNCGIKPKSTHFEIPKAWHSELMLMKDHLDDGNPLMKINLKELFYLSVYEFIENHRGV